MSGDSRKIFVNTNIVYPNGLVIDYGSSSDRLYWTDTASSVDYVQSIKLDGSDRQSVMRRSAVKHFRPFDISVYNKNLHVSDWNAGLIYHINKENGDLHQTIKTTESGKQQTIMGLAMFDKSRQPEGK